MGNQVNPTANSVPGLSIALAGSSVQRAGPDLGRPVKNADGEAKPKILDVRGNGGTTQTPEAAIGDLNNYLEQANSEIKFQVDKGTGRTVFQIINQTSGTVVMQVPSEEVLSMARNLQSQENSKDPSGILVNREG